MTMTKITRPHRIAANTLRLLFAFTSLAAPGLAYAQAPSGNRIISGVVTGAGGQPLEGALVSLSEHGNRAAETSTDAQGRFSFTGLPDGRFDLLASRHGYASSAYQEHGGVSTAIVTGENQVTEGLALSLASLGAISGTVTEDSGDPVPQARLQLFLDDPMRLSAKVRANSIMADEMGNFDLPQLAPGVYYLCASGAPWYRQARSPAASPDQPRSPLDVAYAPVCYSDTPDPAAAEPITVSAGDRVEINLTLHAVPAMRLSFQVPRTGSNQGIQMPQLSQDILGSRDFIQGGTVMSGNLGDRNANDSGSAVTLTMSGIAPGQYEIELPGIGENPGPSRFGTVRVGSSDLAVDTSALQSAAAISGKLLMESSGKPPDSASISLIGDTPEPVASTGIEPDGSFQINNAPPGNYEIRIFSSNGLLAVSKLKVNGAETSGPTLHLGSDPIEVTVLAAAPIASVSGSVVREGKPAGGIFVLLVPADLQAGATSWIVNQSDSDGSFESESVPPGRYTAVAIDQGWKLDWRRPEVITPYLAHGVPLVIAAGAHSAALKGPLEAQGVLAAQ
jgi:Carboxypeptidase regulatory-like domain